MGLAFRFLSFALSFAEVGIATALLRGLGCCCGVSTPVAAAGPASARPGAASAGSTAPRPFLVLFRLRELCRVGFGVELLASTFDSASSFRFAPAAQGCGSSRAVLGAPRIMGRECLNCCTDSAVLRPSRVPSRPRRPLAFEREGGTVVCSEFQNDEFQRDERGNRIFLDFFFNKK